MTGAATRLVFALDVATAREARQLVRRLAPVVGVFKIGLQLFVAEGPDVVRVVRRLGGDVFLDLKLHDIPETAARAAVEAARLDVRMMTLHAGGGRAMLEAARARVAETCRREGLKRPALLGVTVLTSLADEDVAAVGVAGGVAAQVGRLAALAHAVGMDGVVASPHEVARVRALDASPGWLVVTPGVRPAGSDAADQKRVLGPAEAMAAGAGYLVVGRPIRDAEDPVAAASAIARDMARGMRMRRERTAETARGDGRRARA